MKDDNWLARLAALLTELTQFILQSFNIVVIVFFTGFLLILGLLMIIFKVFLGNGL